MPAIDYTATKRTCSIDDCHGRVKARGLCGKHYTRFLRHGSPFTALSQHGSISQRLLANTDKSGDCWLWTHSCDDKGYGKIRIGGRHIKAHRAAWAEANGEILDGLHVLHRCDVRNCVNPAHLFLGTNADNVADMVAKGRQSKGENQPAAKLTEDIVRSIRSMAANGVKQRIIGDRFGVDQSSVSYIVHRKTWAHVPERK